MRLLVALDNGFGNVKIFFKWNGVEYKRDFESRVVETNIKTDDTYSINDTLYNFTDAPLVTELGHCTKDNPIHRVLRDKALYEVYKITGCKEFDVITNCSLDSYKQDRGESVKKMYNEKKDISVEDYFGNKVSLKVNDIECYAENLAGIIICKDINLKSDTVIAIDIGTKNFQILSLNEAKLEKTYSSTLGMNMVYMEAYDLVKTINNKIKSPKHIKDYLRKTHNGTFDIIPAIDEAIYKALEKEIFPEISNMLNNLDSLFTKYVFIGGGSDYLKRFLEMKFKEEKQYSIYFTKDSFYANAIGLYLKGEKLLGYSNGEKKTKPKSTRTKSSKGKASNPVDNKTKKEG